MYTHKAKYTCSVPPPGLPPWQDEPLPTASSLPASSCSEEDSRGRGRVHGHVTHTLHSLPSEMRGVLLEAARLYLTNQPSPAGPAGPGSAPAQRIK